ncbi:sensor histidine kinase [Kribbella sp. WER1]
MNFQVPRLWQQLDVTVRDLSIGLVLLIATFVPSLGNHGTQLGGLPDRPFDALAVVVVAVQCLSLALRRRSPLVCLVLVSAGFAVDQLRGYHTVAASAVVIALLSAGAHLQRRRRLVAVLLTAAYVPLATVLYRLGDGTEPITEFVTFYLVAVVPWAIGSWLRSTRSVEAEQRRRIAEDTRTAERTRIARELHDVVTHHVTAMVVQAEAAKYLAASPERLDQTLTTITHTGRRAIADLRHLLDLLNPNHGTDVPSGSPGGLLTLVEQARQAGQPVEFVETGTPADASGSADLVAYRVVQESLTNALKHAHGGRTSVEVQHSEREITVHVSTDASGRRSATPDGGGRGLAGLRERVDVLGGDFDAGLAKDGGFVVRVRIPTGSRG